MGVFIIRECLEPGDYANFCSKIALGKNAPKIASKLNIISNRQI